QQPGIPDLTDAHPIMMVSQNDANAFCQWLSKIEQKNYRLPSEAEWKWACRAGSAAQTPHEGDLDRLRDICWYRSNSQDRPQPVGLRKPNAWGLYDMHGNVSEMCRDPFDKLPAGSFDDFAR